MINILTTFSTDCLHVALVEGETQTDWSNCVTDFPARCGVKVKLTALGCIHFLVSVFIDVFVVIVVLNRVLVLLFFLFIYIFILFTMFPEIIKCGYCTCLVKSDPFVRKFHCRP